jgi:hypothetical protein
VNSVNYLFNIFQTKQTSAFLSQGISNQSEDHGGGEGDLARDEGVAEVTKEKVVVVLVIVAEEEEIMAEIVEETEQA